MKEKLIICTLGEFTLTYKDQTISDLDTRSKKVWTLIEYLISFHTKEVSCSTLYELLWPEEDRIDYENSLKTVLHRARKLLDRLHFEESIILKGRNTLSFNKHIAYKLDIELFEQICQEAFLSSSADEKLLLLKNAFSMYKGDFLPKSAAESWAVPIVTYYHTLYLKMIHELITVLNEAEQYEDIITYTSAASIIDPYDEIIQYHLITSLLKTGRQALAFEKYNRFTRLVYHNLGENPSEEFRLLSKEITKYKTNSVSSTDAVWNSLSEQDRKPKAFLCDFVVFQNIYQMKARSIQRSRQPVYICLFTIEYLGDVQSEARNTTVARLGEAIGSSLRIGDIYSRYSVNQWILMLTNINHENSVKVCKRILKNLQKIRPFYRTLPITFDIRQVWSEPRKISKSYDSSVAEQAFIE